MGAQPNPRIRSVATAVPSHRMTQDEVKNFSSSFFAGAVSGLGSLLGIFSNAAIGAGYVCAPMAAISTMSRPSF